MKRCVTCGIEKPEEEFNWRWRVKIRPGLMAAQIRVYSFDFDSNKALTLTQSANLPPSNCSTMTSFRHLLSSPRYLFFPAHR